MRLHPCKKSHDRCLCMANQLQIVDGTNTLLRVRHWLRICLKIAQCSLPGGRAKVHRHHFWYRGPPQGCFIIGTPPPHTPPNQFSLACENYKTLTMVDLSHTTIKTIHESTFSCCVSPQHTSCATGHHPHAQSMQRSNNTSQDCCLTFECQNMHKTCTECAERPFCVIGRPVLFHLPRLVSPLHDHKQAFGGLWWPEGSGHA